MPPIRLKISVSGVRGVVGETLTPRLLCQFSQAFGSFVGPGRVLVGRDTRPSGAMVSNAVFAGLMSTGCRPIDVGVAPIPSVQLRCARRIDICGGIVITASHNPAEWNALKLLSEEGYFLNLSEANELLDIYHQGVFNHVDGADVPQLDHDEEAIETHIDAVLEQVDVELIRKAKLRVAIDCANGAGAVATPQLLARLGCKVVASLGCQPSGLFSRPPEPRPENLQLLCERVRQGQVDVGFAQDADADRLAVVDADGNALEGDVMLALLIDLVLQRQRGPVVVNLSTSRLIEHIAAKHDAPVIRTPVGESNVVEGILAVKAVVGGEGSGGLIYPAIHPCRDSLIAMAILLEHLARRKQTVGQMVGELPERTMIKDTLPLHSHQARRLLELMRRRLAKTELDLRDGVKAVWKQGWVHVRPSNTEPIVRVIVEADTAPQAAALKQRVIDLVQELQTS